MSRNKVALLVSGCLLIGAAVACGHKVDNAKNDKTKGATTATKAGADKKTGTASPDSVELKGGMPGAIQVMGVLVKDNELVSGVDKKQTAGFNSKGAKGTQQGKVVLSEKLTDADQSQLKDLGKLENYANLGCSENALKEFKLPAKKDDAQVGADGVLAITANTVVLCDRLPENAKIVNIKADTLLISSARLELKASQVENVILKANRLFLRGENAIIVTETLATTTSTEIPRISIAVAEKLDAPTDASLSLETIGANAGQVKQAVAPTAPKTDAEIDAEAKKAGEEARTAALGSASTSEEEAAKIGKAKEDEVRAALKKARDEAAKAPVAPAATGGLNSVRN